ncbi:dihydrofolate reductase [Mumia sp. zg.B53]|uniref:dihydrofolate reductase n=1 Tax=Mumia sp. zg.B53 TaxID=2855449 RepID=UPI001C6E365D|nr:dihydrofolate reductase [Mumia sp. zg.B53]MBW9216501.1 dihydrofolate reductase [Mumia sp. zg.B53]
MTLDPGSDDDTGRGGHRARITLVAAVGTNGVIGRDGGLPWPPTGDLAQFKALTTGHVLVMGRKTWDSIGRPLPRRTSVVVTRRTGWKGPDEVVVSHDVDGALDLASELDDEVFVIGGEQLYAQSLSRADRMVLTHVDAAPPGDAWFPEVDWSQWREAQTVPYEGYRIVTYERV